MRLRWLFRNAPDKQISKLRVRNIDFKPPAACRGIEDYITDVQRRIRKSYVDSLHTYRHRGNYRRDDMECFKGLTRRLDLIIRDTDKHLGPGIFLYQEIDLCSRTQLSDKTTYKCISIHEACILAARFAKATLRLVESEAHKAQFTADQHKFITQRFCDLLDPRKCNYMGFFINSLNFPRWYILPKIHKGAWALKSVPRRLDGRPICPSFGYITHHLSQWVSAELNFVALKLSTVCASTIELVNDLESFTCSDDYTLGTADITALYPSIPIDKGIETVRAVLVRFSTWTEGHIDTVIAALRLVLTSNVFGYEELYILQLCGTAMGTPCAPPYANIFVFGLEYGRISTFKGVIFFKRFVDDCFFAVLKRLLAAFQALLNGLCDGIVFTFGGTDSHCVMLDLSISKGPKWLATGHLDYAVYQKPINAYHYLTYHSDHPRATKQGFVKGELMRYARNSSNPDVFLDICRDFYLRLRNRGYPPGFLLPIFKAVSYGGRLKALTGSPHRPIIMQALMARNSVPSLLSQQQQPLFLNLPFSRFADQIPLHTALKLAWSSTIADPEFYNDPDAHRLFSKPPGIVWSLDRSVGSMARGAQKHSTASRCTSAAAAAATAAAAIAAATVASVATAATGSHGPNSIL